MLLWVHVKINVMSKCFGLNTKCVCPYISYILYVVLSRLTVFIYAAKQWYLSCIHFSSYLKPAVWKWNLKYSWDTRIIILTFYKHRYFPLCSTTTVCSLERFIEESRKFKVKTVGGFQSSGTGQIWFNGNEIFWLHSLYTAGTFSYLDFFKLPQL